MTFRVADSLSKSVLEQLRKELEDVDEQTEPRTVPANQKVAGGGWAQG